MNVYWCDRPYAPPKPYTPHLLTMLPVEGPGWVKVSHKTPEALEPLREAMREAASNPKATYPELEILLRRLASSCGAEVHRRGGISHGVQIEFKDVLQLSLLEEAGLEPQRIKNSISWRSNLWQDVSQFLKTLYGFEQVYYTFPCKKIYHPSFICKYGITALKHQVFSSRLLFKCDFEHDLFTLTPKIQEIVDKHESSKAYQVKIVPNPPGFDSCYCIQVWWKASLDQHDRLVRHT